MEVAWLYMDHMDHEIIHKILMFIILKLNDVQEFANQSEGFVMCP